MLEQILSKLISFKSVSKDHKENQRALDWVKSQVRGLPVFIKQITVNGFPNLIITTTKTEQPKLWLQGHIDVVDGPNNLFKAKKIGNKLYGRGVFDMKFAAACYVKLLQDFGKTLKDFDFGIMLTTDEELGGNNGAAALIKQGYRSEICFLPDGGNDFSLEKSAKGVYQILVSAKGKSAHGARPWSGVNAIDELYTFIGKLKKYFPAEPCKDSEHYHNSINIGKIAGGNSINKIPDYAEAHIDIRFVTSDAKKKIGAVIKKLVKDSEGITVKLISTTPAYSIDLNNKYHKLFQEILRQRIGRVNITRSHGTCDARYFVTSGIPSIVLRPKGGGHHGNQEWIDLKSLDKFYTILKEFVQQSSRINS